MIVISENNFMLKETKEGVDDANKAWDFLFM